MEAVDSKDRSKKLIITGLKESNDTSDVDQ